MAKKEEKTNVCRLLDAAGIAYTVHTYPHEEGAVDAMSVARLTGCEAGRIFKTLVTRGASGAYYVFDVPAPSALDLKKAAKAVGEKSVAMILSRELLGLTGYVHGGCSPIGMKKPFVTVFDETAELYESILVSAGKIGWQVELSPEALIALTGASTADITEV